MKIINALSEIPQNIRPAVFTIGNFDGLHLGHKTLLRRLHERAKDLQGQSVVLTFQEHPSTVLTPSRPIMNLTTHAHKIKLLQASEVDLLILLPFTPEFSQQTAEQFLNRLHAVLPFSELILGHDAVIGKNRQGDKSIVASIAQQLDFRFEYLVPTLRQGIPISSSQIRKELQQGHFSIVSELLGRPYSIYSEVIKGNAQGRRIGFPTANMDVSGLCLPPYGVYAVQTLCRGILESAVANLGIAPTLRDTSEPRLEVHLLNKNVDLYEEDIEVIFHQYLRPEKKFHSIDELKNQISQDIEAAKTILRVDAK